MLITIYNTRHFVIFFILFTFIIQNLRIKYENYNWINNLLCNFYTYTFIQKYH